MLVLKQKRIFILINLKKPSKIAQLSLQKDQRQVRNINRFASNFGNLPKYVQGTHKKLHSMLRQIRGEKKHPNVQSTPATMPPRYYATPATMPLLVGPDDFPYKIE